MPDLLVCHEHATSNSGIGSTADAFTLFDKLEGFLEKYSGSALSAHRNACTRAYVHVYGAFVLLLM